MRHTAVTDVTSARSRLPSQAPPGRVGAGAVPPPGTPDSGSLVGWLPPVEPPVGSVPPPVGAEDVGVWVDGVDGAPVLFPVG